MSDEMVAKSGNDIEKVAVNALGEPISGAKVLSVNRSTPHIDFSQMLARAVQLLNVGDTISKIQKGIQYVVQVPVEHQAELASGAIELMHGAKSGKTWSTLVRKLENGKNEIVCNCPVVGQNVVNGNPVQKLTDAYQNMYMQQKMAELSAQIKEVYDVCLRIEQGQTDDRIGLLESGREDVVRAMMRKPGTQRDMELAAARSKISTAQHQIGENFKSRLAAFSGIPERHFGRIAREIFAPRTDYMKRKDAEFEQLQDYFEFYLKATQLLASSYAMCGDIEQAYDVYKAAKEFLQSLDFSKLQTFRYVHSESKMRDTIAYCATEYVETNCTMCLEEAKPYDYVTISVSGDELMEVLENGREDVRKEEAQ